MQCWVRHWSKLDWGSARKCHLSLTLIGFRPSNRAADLMVCVQTSSLLVSVWAENWKHYTYIWLFFLFTGPLSSHSAVPEQAHYVCTDLDSAVRLASQPPLADLIETIWIVGGTQVYKVWAAGNCWAYVLKPGDKLLQYVQSVLWCCSASCGVTKWCVAKAALKSLPNFATSWQRFDTVEALSLSSTCSEYLSVHYTKKKYVTFLLAIVKYMYMANT